MESDRLLLPIMNALLAFECAGRRESFSSAAQSMGTSQPSVSRHVANLEAFLGRRLFQRNNNRIELTEDGRRLYLAASVSLENLRQQVAQLRRESHGRVITIGCTHGFSHFWIMPRFSSLQELVPEHEIRIVTSDFSYDFAVDEVDFSVRFASGWGGEGVAARFLDEEIILVAAPKVCATWSLRQGELEPERLLDLPLVHLDNGEEAWLSWREWFAANGVGYAPPGGTYFFRNYAFSLQAAAEGRGIALAWRGVTGSYVSNGWLEVLDVPAIKTEMAYHLTYRDRWARSAEGKSIVEWFQDQASAA